MIQHPGNAFLCNEVLIAIRRIIRSIYLHSKSLSKDFGLTGPQLTILKEIAQASDRTASDLSKAISLSQATVTGILDRLEKKGLITRSKSARDRRRIIIEMTPAGNLLLAGAPPLMQESFVQQFAALQHWEQHMILSSLNRLVSMMDAKHISAAPLLTTDPIEAPPSPARRSSTLS